MFFSSFYTFIRGGRRMAFFRPWNRKPTVSLVGVCHFPPPPPSAFSIVANNDDANRIAAEWRACIGPRYLDGRRDRGAVEPSAPTTAFLDYENVVGVIKRELALRELLSFQIAESLLALSDSKLKGQIANDAFERIRALLVADEMQQANMCRDLRLRIRALENAGGSDAAAASPVV